MDSEHMTEKPNRGDDIGRALADAIVTIEGVANSLRLNPKLDPDEIRHRLLLNVGHYRATAEANDIHVVKIRPDDEPCDFGSARDGHAELDSNLSG